MNNLTELYQHFDNIVAESHCDDMLFASSYVRGFISLAASKYGSESQRLTQVLAQDITLSLSDARTELSPDDRRIVSEYWLTLKANFTA